MLRLWVVCALSVALLACRVERDDGVLPTTDRPDGAPAGLGPPPPDRGTTGEYATPTPVGVVRPDADEAPADVPDAGSADAAAGAETPDAGIDDARAPADVPPVPCEYPVPADAMDCGAFCAALSACAPTTDCAARCAGLLPVLDPALLAAVESCVSTRACSSFDGAAPQDACLTEILPTRPPGDPTPCDLMGTKAQACGLGGGEAGNVRARCVDRLLPMVRFEVRSALRACAAVACDDWESCLTEATCGYSVREENDLVELLP